MKKIISLFQRNYEGDRLVRNEMVPGAEWVLAGEGIATRKYDGTCCMVKGGKLFKRYDVKNGKQPPEDFEAAQEPDATTGHWPGWVPVKDGPEDEWHREAFKSSPPTTDGTYELLGPKIQGNAEKFGHHYLVQHGVDRIKPEPPRDFAGLKEWFKDQNIEGIVWHHPDRRMVKIKKKDFGLKR